MWGFQAAGAAPIVRGHVVEHPETVASAIRIGNPASWALAEAARDDSGGLIDAVSDDQILAAQRDLAVRDGVFVEPASAAGVAGLIAQHAAGAVVAGQTVTVTVTGHGLKDIETPLERLAGEIALDLVIEADVDEAASAAGLADG
jgi:threonine synthase